jgi:hypothetical protein
MEDSNQKDIIQEFFLDLKTTELALAHKRAYKKHLVRKKTYWLLSSLSVLAIGVGTYALIQNPKEEIPKENNQELTRNTNPTKTITKVQNSGISDNKNSFSSSYETNPKEMPIVMGQLASFGQNNPIFSTDTPVENLKIIESSEQLSAQNNNPTDSKTEYSNPIQNPKTNEKQTKEPQIETRPIIDKNILLSLSQAESFVIEDIEQNSTITLFDRNGKTVYDKNSEESTFEFDSKDENQNELSPSIYFLLVRNQGKITQKYEITLIP